MMETVPTFEHPLRLLLAVPWLAFVALFFRLQAAAVGWLHAHVDERFRHRFTRYSPRSLRWHAAALATMGLLLVTSAAGPGLLGQAEMSSENRRVLLLLDASASMYAQDAEGLDEGEERPANRFELARGIARELVAGLPEARFAFVTWSGVSTVQLPMTADRELLEEALARAEPHTTYRRSGSSFAAALDAVLPFAADPMADLQVVLLSDGEPPQDPNLPAAATGAGAYGDALAAVAAREIPVHALALGSLEGEAREIYDFRDVLAKKTPRRVLRQYETRRVDRHLRRMARDTGGTFGLGTRRDFDALLTALRERPARRAVPEAQAVPEAERQATRRDLSAVPLALFLLAFFVDAMLFGRGGSGPPPAFEIGRLGSPGPRSLALLLLLTAGLGCDKTPEARAHRENERGIALDTLTQHPAARRHYERSRGFGVRPHVPTYNLARSLTLARQFAEAHEAYQQALELEPELAEAFYNDGVTLFDWGEAERDPDGCQLERTLDLWRNAQRRFADAQTAAPRGNELAERAALNLTFLESQIEGLENLLENPPPACAEPPPSATESPDGGEGDPDEDRQDDGGQDDGGQDDGGQDDGGQDDGEGDSAEGGGGGGGQPLGEGERETIREALERIATQAREEGKYHRRTLPEQFPASSWENPDSEIWW